MLTSYVSIFVLGQAPFSGGQELLNSSFQKLLKAKSVTFTMKMSGMQGMGEQPPTQLSLMRGGYYRMKMPTMEMLATPGGNFMLEPEKKQYMKFPSMGSSMADAPFPGLEAFRKDGKPAKAAGDPILIQLEGKDVYRVPVNAGDVGMPKGVSLLIDRKTVLPAGLQYDINGQKMVFSYVDLAIDTLAEESFAWTPPDDWKLKDPSSEAAAQSEGEDEYTAKLLKVGVTAPDFAAKTADGQTMRLSQYRKGKKATLVNFWFYG